MIASVLDEWFECLVYGGCLPDWIGIAVPSLLLALVIVGLWIANREGNAK